MSRDLAVLSIIFFAAFVCRGQDLTPLAGTWVLDQQATFGKKADRTAYKRFDLEFILDGEKIVLKKHFDFRGKVTNSETTLFPDGRGESNLRAQVRSKTKIRDGWIVREYTVGGEESPLGLNRMDRVTEKFSLSKDGRYLTYVRRQVSEIEPGDLRVKTMGNLHTKVTLIFRRS